MSEFSNEDFTEEGRIPFGFGDLVSGDPKSGKRDSNIAFFLTPEGTQPGDGIEGNPIKGYRIINPEQESRGYAKLYVVPNEIGEFILQRTKAVLESSA